MGLIERNREKRRAEGFRRCLFEYGFPKSGSDLHPRYGRPERLNGFRENSSEKEKRPLRTRKEIGGSLFPRIRRYSSRRH